MILNQQIEYKELVSRLYTEKSALWKKMLIKLCIFAAVLVVNHLFFSYLLLWIFIQLGAAELPPDALYLVNWVLNDLSAYLLPMVSLLFIFRKELRDKLACRRYAALIEGRSGFQPVLETVLCFAAMLFVGSMATMTADLIAEAFDAVFGTGEIQDALSGVAPENYTNFTVFFIFVCFIGPVCEEIIFRHLLLRPLRRCGDGVAVLLTAFAFGVYHGNFDQFPYAFAVGIFLGLLAVRSNNVLFPMILHVVNNTMVSFSQYLVEAVGENQTTLFIQTLISLLYNLIYYGGIASLVFLIILKKFRLYNYSAPVQWRDKLRTAFKHPAAYIGLVMMVLLFF